MWRKQTDLFFVRKDTVVFSAEMRYAGALDALARKISTRGLVILDWKTSNRFSHDYAYQVAAYAKALEEMTGEPVEEGWAVRFDKHKPIFEVRRVRDLDDSFEVFKVVPVVPTRLVLSLIFLFLVCSSVVAGNPTRPLG
jgi:hypothetical protein